MLFVSAAFSGSPLLQFLAKPAKLVIRQSCFHAHSVQVSAKEYQSSSRPRYLINGQADTQRLASGEHAI